HLGDELDRRRDLGREHLDDLVAERVLPVAHPHLVELDEEVVIHAPLVAEACGRDDDEPVVQVPDRLRVLVAEGLAHVVRSHTDAFSPSASAAHTFIERNDAYPKVVIIATSRASRPRPMSTRPTRRWLLRGSNVHQRSPSHTSIHAAKSIGSGFAGTYRSGR